MDEATLRERLTIKFRGARYVDDCVLHGISVIRNVRWGAGRRGMSLRQLADLAGISERALHLILAGRTSPSFEHLVDLAYVLRVWPGDLLRREEEFRGLDTFLA